MLVLFFGFTLRRILFITPAFIFAHSGAGTHARHLIFGVHTAFEEPGTVILLLKGEFRLFLHHGTVFAGAFIAFEVLVQRLGYVLYAIEVFEGIFEFPDLHTLLFRFLVAEEFNSRVVRREILLDVGFGDEALLLRLLAG